jgi:hypothetical protein
LCARGRGGLGASATRACRLPDEPVTLPAQCVRCRRAVTLAYVPRLVVQHHDWACPYEGCSMLQTLEVLDHDVTAAPRYPSTAPDA